MPLANGFMPLCQTRWLKYQKNMLGLMNRIIITILSVLMFTSQSTTFHLCLDNNKHKIIITIKPFIYC